MFRSVSAGKGGILALDKWVTIGDRSKSNGWNVTIKLKKTHGIATNNNVAADIAVSCVVGAACKGNN